MDDDGSVLWKHPHYVGKTRTTKFIDSSGGKHPHYVGKTFAGTLLRLGGRKHPHYVGKTVSLSH